MSKERLVYFGKHARRTFDWVAQNDRQYFEWLLTQPRISRRVARFMKEALDRNPIKPYTQPLISNEQQAALDAIYKMRREGLDYLP